jgi:HPt (histidine-containing phosphotransfer) domain-containing protein
MLTIDALNEFGANTAEGLGRCMDNETFYLKLVKMAVKDDSFNKLADAVAAGDKDAAFEAAHALKGVLANLSLTPIAETASEITELLRAREDADYPAYLEKLLKMRDDLAALCEE